MAPTRYPPFPPEALEAVAAILGDTDYGLKNKQIEEICASIKLQDPVAEAKAHDPRVQQGLMYVSINKRDRILRALQGNQARNNTGNALIAFVTAAMKPQRYTGGPKTYGDVATFERRRGALSEALVLSGFQISERGQVSRSQQASTLSEAAAIAGRLHTELKRRGIHKDVLKYCTEEVLAKNTFHAALEAVKGVFDRLRALTGIDLDGAGLAQQALACKSCTPPLFLNPLRTESERSEQTGFMNLVIGLFSMYRNPTAHEPKIVRQAERPITELELLELFTTLSMVHRKLDGASPNS